LKKRFFRYREKLHPDFGMIRYYWAIPSGPTLHYRPRQGAAQPERSAPKSERGLRRQPSDPREGIMLKCKAALFVAVGAAALMTGLSLTPAIAADVTMEDILNDAKSTDKVVSYGMGPEAQRFSPLESVNKENVANLVPAWSFSLGGEKQRGQESQPLVMDGVIYLTGSYSRMWAIDAKTGEEIWQYDHRLPEGILPCCDVVNRGAAAFGDKVFFGTLDAKIVALDAKTGKVVWTKTIDDFKAGYSYTAAPLIVPSEAHGPLLVTGVSGGEFGVIGRVEARKVENGELAWSRPVIEGHMGQLNGKDSSMTAGPPGSAAPTIRPPSRSSWARGTPRHGTRICARATISTPAAALRSIRRPARSSGTSRPRRMTAGTMTA
jgi:glucose dehydrogenase